MPGSKLWGISGRGNVYTLSTKGRRWCQVPNQSRSLRGFKKVSAGLETVWGLGCDHQVYVFVPASDLPIRCQEATYENERWIPSRGWSSHNLLPAVDPWQWSSEDGLRHLPKEDFRLPSEHWQWESDWYVDENIGGYLTDKGGWRYATIDFHHDFTHQKKLKSCVRRRRWIRYRRYVSTEKWARVPSLHVDPLEEPVVDVAIGGQDVINQAQGYLSAWVVTINGRLLYRAGVSRACPEGSTWEVVPTAEGWEVLSVSVGPSGLLWAVTWAGTVIIRLGVTWQTIMGLSWVEVQPPEEEDKLVQVAVGTNAVWATTVSGKIWFRKGVCAARAGLVREAAAGTGWVSMMHRMRLVTLGPSDQVWGIDYDDRQVYFRSGVTRDEQTGKAWRQVDLPYCCYYGNTNRKRTRSTSSRTSRTSMVSPHSGDTTGTAEQKFPADGSAGVVSQVSPEPGGGSEQPSPVSTDVTLVPDETIARMAGTRDYVESYYALTRINDQNDSNSVSELDRENGAGGAAAPTAPASKAVVAATAAEGEGTAADVQGKQGPGEGRDTVDGSMDSQGDSQSVTSGDRTPTNLDSPTAQYEAVMAAMAALKKSKSIQQIKSLIKKKTEQISEHLSPETPSSVLHRDVTVTFKIGMDSVNLMESSITSLSRGGCGGGACSTGSGSLMETSMTSLPRSSSDLSTNSSMLGWSEFGSVCGWDPTGRGLMGTDVGIEDDDDLDDELDDDGYHADIFDEGDIHWVWVSATACPIKEEVEVRHWLAAEAGSNRSSSIFYHRQFTTGTWRSEVLSLLRTRNQVELEPFRHYPLAIERACWSKKGKLRWWQDIQRGARWVDCNVELTQDVDGTMDGSFAIQYELHGKQKFLQISLSDLLCVCTVTEAGSTPTFTLHTTTRITAVPRVHPLKMAAAREEDMEDWMASLTVACSDQRKLHGSSHPTAIWALTDRGDLFVHEPQGEDKNGEPCSLMFWHQLGGHLAKVESNRLGVVWGIGYDGAAWVYTGGYGGGFFKGVASSPQGIHAQTDQREVFIYENQRWRPVFGYTDKVLLSDRYTWSDETGRVECTKENTRLLSRHWLWVTEWQIDHRTPGGVDKEGWQYARDFKGAFRPRPRLRSYVRRRRWMRRCRIMTCGPWVEVGPVHLRDVSLQIDPRPVDHDMIAVWAIGANGDVLCRSGVNCEDPEGSAWLHIPTDQPFVSISVGGNLRVWGVARDGSAWYRGGVAPFTPTGTCWYHIAPPPKGTALVQISVGATQVYAVDSSKVLWTRMGISHKCPEGTSWLQVSTRVRQVSLTPDDQIWAVMDDVACKGGAQNGVLSRRVDMSRSNPAQGNWDYGIGDFGEDGEQYGDGEGDGARPSRCNSYLPTWTIIFAPNHHSSH